MNKDKSACLTTTDRFNLFLSNQAIERELSRIKRPTVNVENIPKRLSILCGNGNGS